jgi:peptide/nickel transport system substrate-binding protein
MKLAQVVTIFGAAVLCLSGCGKKAETVSPENAENAAENSDTNYPFPDPPVVVNCTPGIRGGKFIISEIGEPKTFNYIAANEESSYDICRFMFWDLLNFDVPTQTVKPGLADFWTNSPDGKTWTFRLRKNLRWSDGAPLTADDVLFTCNDIIFNPKIPDNPARDSLEINGKAPVITKLDDLTIQIVLPEVYAPFLEEFGAGVPIFPKHILAQSVADGTFSSAYGVNSDPKDMVGSGPFRLKEYKQAQYTILERNPYFIEVDTNGTRLPYFDDIIFTVVPDFDAMSLRFLSKESDVNDWVMPYNYDTYKAEADQGKFTLLEPGVGLEMYFICFNENTNMDAKTGDPLVATYKLKWFRNQKFRQAIAYAINRQAIIQSVYSGHATPRYGSDTTGDPKWNNPNISTYPYDPDKALELLKEIGIEKRNGDDFLTDTDGNKIEFVVNLNTGSASAEKSTVLVQGDLQKLGMHVILQPIEFNTLISKLSETYQYECAFTAIGSGSSTDPADAMNVYKSNGFTHDWFPQQKTPSTEWEARINQLMDDQISTLDLNQREKDFDEVQEIIAEQQPMIFTVTPMFYAAIRLGVGNVRPTVIGGYRATWNAEELYYEK